MCVHLSVLLLLLQILSVRTHGETGSHLPDEVMQPGLLRQLRSSSNNISSSSSKSGTSKCTALKAGGSSTFDSAGSANETAAAACPSAYEYYVHYRLTNRRLDCWLRFSDLLPVNARGQVLLPTGYDQQGTSRQSAAATGAAGGAAADTAALEAVRDQAAANTGRTDEHMPKRMKLSHEGVFASEGAAAAAAAAEEPMASSPSPAAATPPAGEREAEDDCAAAAAAWRQLELERNAEAEELKALLFDPSLVFSDHDDEEHEGMDSATLAAHEEATRVKTVNRIFFGGQEIDTWYFSPYPAEAQATDLHICEFCLSFFLKASELLTHSLRCTVRHPPGNEIYRDGHLSMFEVDGKAARVYSENLCFLAKLFLDHKTLQFDVEPFLFYVLTEVDAEGAHLIGYFSKEKVSLQGYNLACILTLPQHQRKGYGRFLISFSYVLSLKENKRGGPERPLSDLGRLSYIGWWSWRLLNLLSEPQWAAKRRVSIHELVRATAIRPEDIQRTLEEIGVLR
ncbi:histone acetyltransferase, putative [Eimeria praecox]|uniref:Histone acetyltransferase n=1 Tax=Eimeria praecox TaxID=51316 RepID=U6G0L5_9EIME|nr:histone acetyltransferase, putative [Eimeria praecox]